MVLAVQWELILWNRSKCFENGIDCRISHGLYFSQSYGPRFPPEITCEETAQIALCLFWAGDVTKYYPSFAVENNGIVICKLEKITEIGSNRMP